MFIRSTLSRTTADGTRYYTYRLVDNCRVGDRVRQKTLLSLGSQFSIPQSQWPELTERVEQLLRGQQEALFPPEEAIERTAQAIVRRLLHKYPDADWAGDTPDAAEGTIRRVDLADVEPMDSRTVGAEAVALAALLETGLPDYLAALGFNTNLLHAAIGQIVARMVAPGSEHASHEWLQQTSALGDLLGFDFEQQGRMALYRASDQLWANRAAIEDFLYRQHRAQFGLDECITLYDLSNTFFEGTGAYNDQAAYGHSKERRTDCPLVTLGLVLDGSGFSRSSRIFPGNASEPATLQTMIEQLRSPPSPPGNEAGATGALDLDPLPTIVMDAGIASEANIQWLKAQGYPYLVVARQRDTAFDPDQCTPFKEAPGETVRATRVERADGDLELHCHSQPKEAKERAIEQRFQQRFEAALADLAEGLHQPRRLKRADKVREKIGRLRAHYPRVAGDYTITVETDDAGDRATAIHYQRSPSAEAGAPNNGTYCLRTNRTDWSAQQLWTTYTRLTDLEAVFRSLKSELGLRPVYHQKGHRVEGHLFITLLAYNLVHQIRYRLKEQGIHDAWPTLRATLASQVRVTIRLRGENGESIHIRKATWPNAGQQRILRGLGL
ncbi:MAG: IS1634 family transposase, partial [Thiohalorhabdaceae bacterium]